VLEKDTAPSSNKDVNMVCPPIGKKEAVSSKEDAKMSERRVDDSTTSPKKKDTVGSSKQKKEGKTFSVKKALAVSTKGKGDKKSKVSTKKDENASWEKKMKSLNGFKVYSDIVGSIYQAALYTFKDLLQPTGVASDEVRSPASQKFFNAVSTASKKASSTSSRNVLVLGKYAWFAS